MTRCINIDWLEVYALEPPQPRDADYFRGCGIYVDEREYGTRVYAEMFTLYGTDGYPLLEIRRKPLSTLMEPYACHVRLVNRICYYEDCVNQLRNFLNGHGYYVSRISRIDIALDFERFDSGDDPNKFIQRYIKGKYSKINQANVHAHGADTWTSRNWCSLSWGSPKSQIGTKLYNKTKELAEVKDKPYIRQAWFASGLVDNPTTLEKTNAAGETYFPQIYRLEFSIRSSVKGWFVIEEDGNAKQFHSYRNNFDMYDSRDKLLAVFNSLQQHYFSFRHYENGRSKYDCKPKQLFNFSPEDTFYKVAHPSSDMPRKALWDSLINKLNAYRASGPKQEAMQAAAILIEAIQEDNMRRDLANPFSIAELRALREAIAARSRGNKTEPTRLITQIRSFLEENEGQIW